MVQKFAVVDLFAGPGGLAEGFCSVQSADKDRPFSVVLSVEKEFSAFQTLLLRNFIRQFGETGPKKYYSFLNGEIDEPDWSSIYPRQWAAARHESLNLELGTPEAAVIMDQRIDAVRRRHGGNIVLIGGPPCQAYSLAGRARNKSIAGYQASEDHRHFLYKEYIRILDRLRPAMFVMENVKGMLSSAVDGQRVFDRVIDDLAGVGAGAYRLVPLTPREDSAGPDRHGHPPASDFVIRAEDLGLPQARHRVIVVGIRKDVAEALPETRLRRGLLTPSSSRVTVRDVLHGMPKLRSGMSTGDDSFERWRETVLSGMRAVSGMVLSVPPENQRAFRSMAEAAIENLSARTRIGRSARGKGSMSVSCPKDLQRWLSDWRLDRLPNNETRGHMASDLARYFFASCFARVNKCSPKAGQFPEALAPDHRNWTSGNFVDRFRVQLWDEPATTITSHISKDGHYFIHPDPLQCRSLTVREAARLQTFPDNYLFKGNRTQQYVQVGNAVPPFLARKLAKALHKLLEQASNRSNNAVKIRRSPQSGVHPEVVEDRVA